MRYGILLATALATGCLSGCTGPQSAPAAAVVSGTVTYRQRIALPPSAVIRVRLADVSRQDAAADVLAEVEIPAAGRQVPIPFRLTYWPERIEPSHTYVVRAEIRVEGALFMASTTGYPVITRGAPNEAELRVEPVN